MPCILGIIRPLYRNGHAVVLGRVIAALGISDPVERPKSRIIHNIASTILKAGEAISALRGVSVADMRLSAYASKKLGI